MTQGFYGTILFHPEEEYRALNLFRDAFYPGKANGRPINTWSGTTGGFPEGTLKGYWGPKHGGDISLIPPIGEFGGVHRHGPDQQSNA